jgi:hypothetical protein
VALLQLANLPVPSEALGHPDVASIPALLTIPAQQDVAKLALAERAAERGAISIPALETVYRSIPFSPEALTGALTSSESGLRLHALLFHASEGENDPAKRIALATKFLQTATPAFSNGAGYVAADMLGAIKTDPALSANAVAVTRIYMLAGRGDAALDWLRLAQGNAANAEALLLLWPQFALAGLEAEGNFAADFDKWLEAMLKLADTTTTEGHAPREVAASTLLLLDSAGFKIPDSAWAKVLSAERNEKHIAFDPALWERLQAAASANRRAETVLLAVALAGDGDISIPEAVAITRALHNAGFKSEAAIFARQAVAPLVKLN